jgi:hypothetical protein
VIFAWIYEEEDDSGVSTYEGRKLGSDSRSVEERDDVMAS